MMEEKKLIPAPIDNKNIMEDFTDDFHEGDFVEHVENRVHRQAFWKCGALCVISYEFGNNWFDIQFVSSTEQQEWAAAGELAVVMLALRENYVIKEGPGGVYLIYFRPEDCE